MKNLTMISAALAAGLMTCAAQARDVHDDPAYEHMHAQAPKSATAESPSIDRTTTGSASAGKANKIIAKERKGGEAAEPAGGKSQYSQIITRYAATYGVPVSLAHAIVRVESNFRPNARGKAGEIGLMQIKPSTARMMGYGGSANGLFQPETNIKYGMKYLARAHKLGDGTTCGTVLKYNAGHGARRMNKTSAAYCAKVKRIIGS